MGNPVINVRPENFGAIAFVQAGWHQEIVEQGRRSFEQHLKKTANCEWTIDYFEVPGSLELPLQCQKLAKTNRYCLIIAAGFIVDGKIYRHEFVASTVLDALMRVQLETEIPVLSMVLTPHIYTHLYKDFFIKHFKTKGEELAEASIMTLRNLEMIPVCHGG